MKRAYLLAFNDNELGTQEQVSKCLNEIQLILLWRYDMPNVFYLISEHDAKAIAERIKSYFNKGGKAAFIVTEITSNAYGWLTEESWYMIENKKVKPK